MTTPTEGVERPTPSEAEARRRYLQGELDGVLTPPDGIIRAKFLGFGESKYLNITLEQFEAIKKIIVPEPESPVSYSPCIMGTVDIEGAKSEFMVPFDNDSVKYSQWGADNTVLWPRVDLMDALADAAREWWLDNNPDTDAEEDDGEEGCDDFQPDGSELCAVCNKPYGAHYA
jgi:hypothetical protein